MVGVDGSPREPGAARPHAPRAPQRRLPRGRRDVAAGRGRRVRRARCSVQVLEYVPDVNAALREIHRALRPGGRIVVWDVDWATVSMRPADEERMKRVLAAWDSHLTHPSLPADPHLPSPRRRLRGDPHGGATRSPRPSSRRRATAGSSSPSPGSSWRTRAWSGREASAWADEQRALAERGDFYFACIQFCFAAQRVPAPTASLEAVFRDDPPALELRGLTKRYDDGTLGARGLRPRDPGGRLLRPARPQRGRQDHADQRRLQPDPGHRAARCSCSASRADTLHARSWVGLAEQDINLDRFLTVRETLDLPRRLLRDAARRGRGARRGDDRGLRARAQSATCARRSSPAASAAACCSPARSCTGPRLVILDEPTAGVDFELRTELWRYIRQLHAEGTTILLTTHYLEEAEQLCEEIALIRDGHLIARDTRRGPARALRRRPPRTTST